MMNIRDGSEIRTTSKYSTFCNLCRKRIHRGDQALTWKGHHFLIHTDCSDIETISNKEFKEYGRMNIRYRRRPGRL